MAKRNFKIETYNPFDPDILDFIKSLRVYIKSVRKIEKATETTYQIELYGTSRDLQLILFKIREKELN